jgi:hypothetical protein
MNLNKIKKKVNYSLVQNEIVTTSFQSINSSLLIKQEGSNSYKRHTILKFPEILKKIKTISNSNLKNKAKKLSSSTFKKYNQNNFSKTNSNESKKQLIGNLTLNSFQNKTIIVNSLENTKLNSIFFSFIQLKSFFFKMPENKKDA